MNKRNGKKERRRYPRVKTKLNGVAHREGGGFEKLKIKIIDISANGVYCSANKDLPLFDRLKIVFQIPTKTKNKKIVRNIQCRGVVVRKEKVVGTSKEYHVAVFFDDIEEKTKDILKEFAEQQHESNLF